jgi:phosphopantothenoylcysteine decarboxylase/phosphopantothenate--cysteine ligase
MGRMLDPIKIVSKIENSLSIQKPLSGLRAIVTSGPTFERIDVIRYIGNRSSGKQGHAIAIALAELGAITKLISGPTHQSDPNGVETIHVTSGEEMLHACKKALPADIAICAAAVSDWRVTNIAKNKLKKISSQKPPIISLTENPDILAILSQSKNRRPNLVIGFAAETENIIANGIKKRTNKGCDWLLANDISISSDTIGGDDNQVHLISRTAVDSWPMMSKQMIGKKLAQEIVQHFQDSQ